MGIEVHGRIGVYEPQGQYQLYADVIRSIGEGALFQEFMRLKTLLEAEGLFDLERKRTIPERPGRIGIVTSPTGAALRDILNTLRRRYSLAEVFLAPSSVQGEEAPPELVRALEDLNRVVKPDVILLARGGGSIEDLWAFNDERVVRAVAGSTAPVITGIGHETDFTLADLVADLRAPTPTAAAELATPFTTSDLHQAVVEKSNLLMNGFLRIVDRLQGSWTGQVMRLQLSSPERRIQTEHQTLDELVHKVNAVQAHRLALATTRTQGMTQRLDALNPESVLRRGFAILTRKDDGSLVSRTAQVTRGDDLHVHIQDGGLDVRVTDRQKEHT